MADEVNTTQGTAAPAVGTPQAAPEAAPTQEQQNAFQRFLGSLFGGKAEAPAPAEGMDTTPAPAPKQEPVLPFSSLRQEQDKRRARCFSGKYI